MQANLLYSFNNFQNSELNMLPMSDLYHLIVSQPRDEGGEPRDAGLSSSSVSEIRDQVERGFRSAMSMR